MRRVTLALVCAFHTVVFAQPPNDQCSAVTPVDLAIGSSFTLTGTRTGATTTNDGVSTSVLMSTNGATSVWEAFTTTTCSNVTALFCNTPMPATTMWNFITTCPADVPIYFSYANFGIMCPNGQYGIAWHNLPAGTYYLPIYCTASGGAYTVELSAVACNPGPANDDCAGVIPLNVNTTCTTTPGSVENGTFSFAAQACNGATGNPNDDVWFSFVATGSEHTVTVDCAGGDVDAVVNLFGGACGALSQLACADATFDGDIETLAATDLTVGETYYVRVFHYFTSLAYEPEFTICVTGDVGTRVAEAMIRDLGVQPNPTEGVVSITTPLDAGVVTVRDPLGRVVLAERMVAARHVLDLTTLPAATYIVEVSSPEGEILRTRVVTR